MESLLQIIAAFTAAFTFYIFYNYSFFHPREYRLQLIAFLFGISSAGLAMLIQAGLFNLPLEYTVFNRAFVLAALPEEFSKMAFIYLLIRAHHQVEKVEISVAEGIFYGIILGMSFGVLENVFYGFGSGIWSLVLRSITSLPLHILTSALIAYFLMLFNSGNRSNLSWVRPLKGFVLVVFLHGMYDYSVFSGSAYLIVVPVLLVLLFLFAELVIARSKSFLPGSVLSMIGLNLDDYECIRNHRHYTGWLDLEQEAGEYHKIPVFKAMSRMSLAVFAFFGLASLSMLILYKVAPENIGVYFPGIGFGEYINIFIFYPLFISFTYLTGGLLNPDFISSRITGIPLIVVTMIRSGDYSEDSIIYAIDKKIFFATLQKPDMFPGELTVSFWMGGKSFDNLPGRVLWINQSEEDIAETGALIILEKFSIRINLYWSWLIVKHIMKNIRHSLKKSSLRSSFH